MKKPKFSIETVIKIVLVVLAAIHIYPVLLIILSSVKSKAELAVNPYSLPKNLTFENFEQAFVKMKYFRSILNTSVLVIITVFALIVFGSMAAYAIARKKKQILQFHVPVFYLRPDRPVSDEDGSSL
jgi:ABC-type glycerol-3-phosphate transport system permease component